MKVLGKICLIRLGGVLLIVISILAIPRNIQAQGLAGAPVRVENAPEVYEGSTIASNLIELRCLASASGQPCSQLLPGDSSVANFRVPAGRDLVITSVQISPAASATGANVRLILFGDSGTIHAEWIVPGHYNSVRLPERHRAMTASRTLNACRTAHVDQRGQFGRFFEVTPGGEVVWEYVNPYFGPETAAAAKQMNNVFRVYRHSEDEIAKVRSRS